jgi:hypothetical protein
MALITKFTILKNQIYRNDPNKLFCIFAKTTTTPTEYGLLVVLDIGAVLQSRNMYIATDMYIGFYGDVHCTCTNGFTKTATS